VPPTYLTGEVVLGQRWPLADLKRAAIHKVTLDLLAPGPASNLSVLPWGVPFAYERVVAAFDFLVDADRYAEGNNPGRGRELLAASVAAQAVDRSPHPPAAPVATALTTPNERLVMGFTGSLILARTPVPLTDLDPLAGQGVELVGRREDQWQLAAVDGHASDTPGWAAALIDATTAPVLIAVVDDSDTALLLADSPGGHRWITVLNAPADGAGRAAVADTRAMTAIAEEAVAWAAEAGHTIATEPVLKALRAADRDNRAADQAFSDAAGDVEAMTEVVRTQISFIEVYVLRVLDVLGLAVPVGDAGSWWAHLASQAHTRCP
jgi:hypothetical protein